MSRHPFVDWSQRLIIVGLGVSLVSLVGLHRSWGFLLFAVAGMAPLAVGAGLYIVAAARGEIGRRG